METIPLRLRRRAARMLLGWLAIGIATLSGCSTPGYKSLSTGAPMSDNPRDYYDLGDQARLTLADGAQIQGEVTQLRTDSITLDRAEIPWSQVVLAERSGEYDVDPWRTTTFLAVAGVVVIAASVAAVLFSWKTGLF